MTSDGLNDEVGNVEHKPDGEVKRNIPELSAQIEVAVLLDTGGLLWWWRWWRRRRWRRWRWRWWRSRGWRGVIVVNVVVMIVIVVIYVVIMIMIMVKGDIRIDVDSAQSTVGIVAALQA